MTFNSLRNSYVIKSYQSKEPPLYYYFQTPFPCCPRYHFKTKASHWAIVTKYDSYSGK